MLHPLPHWFSSIGLKIRQNVAVWVGSIISMVHETPSQIFKQEYKFTEKVCHTMVCTKMPPTPKTIEQL